MTKKQVKRLVKQLVATRRPEDYGQHDFAMLGWSVYITTDGKLVYMEPYTGGPNGRFSGQITGSTYAA